MKGGRGGGEGCRRHCRSRTSRGLGAPTKVDGPPHADADAAPDAETGPGCADAEAHGPVIAHCRWGNSSAASFLQQTSAAIPCRLQPCHPTRWKHLSSTLSTVDLSTDALSNMMGDWKLPNDTVPNTCLVQVYNCLQDRAALVRRELCGHEKKPRPRPAATST